MSLLWSTLDRAHKRMFHKAWQWYLDGHVHKRTDTRYDVDSSAGGQYPVLVVFKDGQLYQVKCNCKAFRSGTFRHNGLPTCYHGEAAAFSAYYEGAERDDTDVRS
jgi:hypothetical protein